MEWLDHRNIWIAWCRVNVLLLPILLLLCLILLLSIEDIDPDAVWMLIGAVIFFVLVINGLLLGGAGIVMAMISLNQMSRNPSPGSEKIILVQLGFGVIFPSLLSEAGQQHRRNFLNALPLLGAMIVLMFVTFLYVYFTGFGNAT